MLDMGSKRAKKSEEMSESKIERIKEELRKNEAPWARTANRVMEKSQKLNGNSDEESSRPEPIPGSG